MMTSLENRLKLVALGGRFKQIKQVVTLGVRPNFGDYTEQEQALIMGAAKIYDPTAFYAELFDTLGKVTFPSYHTYKFAQDKIKQTALFSLAGIPHPRTRTFYGKGQKSTILEYFTLPLIAKTPRGSSLGKGVYLIDSDEELQRYCQRSGPAYIQEYLPLDRDMRVVVIGQQVVHAYWRIASPNEYRTNISTGGRIDFSHIPQEVMDLACHTASVCNWNDVGLDICAHQGKYYVLEANMKYGREGFRQAGIDYQRLIETLISKGAI